MYIIGQRFNADTSFTQILLTRKNYATLTKVPFYNPGSPIVGHSVQPLQAVKTRSRRSRKTLRHHVNIAVETPREGGAFLFAVSEKVTNSHDNGICFRYGNKCPTKYSKSTSEVILNNKIRALMNGAALRYNFRT